MESSMKLDKILLGMLIIGALFRLSGIFWGIPLFSQYTGNYHPDEPKVIMAALWFTDHVFTNQDLGWPTGLHYTLGVLSVPFKSLTRLALLESFSTPYYHRLIIHILGRLLSVALGVGAILITYRIGEIVFDRRRALLAGYLLCFSVFHVTNSSVATPDVPTSFLLSLFILLLIKTMKQESVKLALLSGCSLGLLVGTKYNGIFAVIPLLILVGDFVIRKYQRASLLRKTILFLSNNYLWLIGTISVVVFLASTPGIIFREQLFVQKIQSEGSRMALFKPPAYNLLESCKNVADALFKSMGIPLALAGVLGLLFPIKKRSVIEYSLIITAIAYLVFFRNSLVGRHVIILMPVFALMASNFLVYLSEYKVRWVRACGFCLLTLVCLYSFAYTTAAVFSRYPETRTAAARYVDQTVPKGTSIGIAYTSPGIGWMHHYWQYPKINFADYRYKDFLQNPDYIILSSYDFQQIKKTLESGILTDAYELPRGYPDYPKWYRCSPPTPEVFQFYKALWGDHAGSSAEGREPVKKSDYYLVKRFDPKPYARILEFPPPLIEIYARNKS
jgi:hypothetical protein